MVRSLRIILVPLLGIKLLVKHEFAQARANALQIGDVFADLLNGFNLFLKVLGLEEITGLKKDKLNIKTLNLPSHHWLDSLQHGDPTTTDCSLSPDQAPI